MASVSLMMNGMQQFADANGTPYLGGKVYMYVPPDTITPKINWADSDRVAENSNPIILDEAGRCVIWGEGSYRQFLYDQFDNLVWDKITISVASITDVENIVNELMTTVYDLPYSFIGQPANAQVLFRYVCVRAERLPASLVDSQFKVNINPAANWIFTLRKNGSSIGTVTFSTAGAVTVAFAADVDFAAGDVFSLEAQAVADTTGTDPSFTFVKTVLTA